MTTTAIPSTSSSNDAGFIMNLALGNTNYKVLAYFEDAQGVKTYLPSTINAQAMEKIRGLTWGLVNAHDIQRKSLNENYTIKGIESRGLIKSDNAIVSHDFILASVAARVSPPLPSFANQMADSLSQAGHPMQAAAIKAQDIWNTMEELIRRESGQNNTGPVRMNASQSQPTTSVQTTPAVTPTTPTVTSNIPTPPPAPTPPQNGVNSVSIDVNLRSLSWYDRLTDRKKQRLINDILESRSPGGGNWEGVWNHFNSPGATSATIFHSLQTEKRRLDQACITRPVQIPRHIRTEADQIYNAFYRSPAQLDPLITTLMQKEFEHKAELLKLVWEQAIADGVRIENWDDQWAQFHYLDDRRRFVLALTDWLDTY